MKKKTRDYVRAIERACEVARSIPQGCSCKEPEYGLVQDLWTARERFIQRLTATLPEYEIPMTASLLARAESWPDVEGAYRLPDNRLLVCWVDYTEPEVLTEAEYLGRLARRCAQLFMDDMYRNEITDFFRKHLL